MKISSGTVIEKLSTQSQRTETIHRINITTRFAKAGKTHSIERKQYLPVDSNIYQTLESRLNLVLNGGDRSQLLQTLIDSPIELSPWEGWLVLCLIRHRGRQQFVLENMRTRLDGDPEEIAKAGSLGHPDRPRVGLVPGDTDWEYEFHGRGCCMTHRLTGGCIDVDFHDETADWIGHYFFEQYLESLPQPRFVEKRIRELYPSACSVCVGIGWNYRLGCVSMLSRFATMLHARCIGISIQQPN